MFDPSASGTSRRKDMPGGFYHWEVNSIADAISLASSLKNAGNYQAFRGQADAEWGVTSTFFRLGEKDRAEARKKIEAFWRWVKSAPELVPYLKDDDSIIAAAQHHQICATTFIDFTYEPAVAGWFATDGAEVGKFGAIFMVDLKAVADLFATISKRGPILRFLESDVDNLWRLQAQSGLFLEAQTSVAQIWPFDRILFPQNGHQPNIERRKIYPERRSHLEQMIDTFSKTQQTSEALSSFIRDNPQVSHFELDSPPDLTGGLAAPRVLGSEPAELWAQIDSNSPPPKISFDDIETSIQVATKIVNTRRRCTDLTQIVESPPYKNGTLQTRVDELWEGMRPHPYKDDQIATSLVRLTKYYKVFGDYPLNQGIGPDRIASTLLADPIEIEMGLIGGGATRACVSVTDLWSAMTPEGKTFSSLNERPTLEDMRSMLHKMGGHTLKLFDSVRLIEVFSTLIVPWQVAVKRPFIAFWPTHVYSLGLP